MGGIAVAARQAGHRVTGCDSNVYPPMSTQLENCGIELIEGFDPAQLKLKPDIFVVGNVISRGNTLIEEILNQNLCYVSGPQWLYENVLRDKWVLACAGTHGKTTTASMLAWILDYAGLAPGFLIGGVPIDFGISARLSNMGASANLSNANDSPFFVIEADEYDTAFFDKRSKFLHYRPRTLILNNLEYDHADIFPDLAAIERQFHHLIRTVPGNGLIICNARAPALARVLDQGCWTPTEFFGTDTGWTTCANAGNSALRIRFQEKVFTDLKWDLLGEHNEMNALAALAAARHVGVAVDLGIEALSKFKSVRRRMEVRGEVNGITVYDDFAHHPTAIATTLLGLRKHITRGRVIAVLEPRSNTMRMGAMKDELANCLMPADLVYCYTHNVDWDAESALRPIADKVRLNTNINLMLDSIVSEVKVGDHIVIMSNGGFENIHSKLLARLA